MEADDLTPDPGSALNDMWGNDFGDQWPGDPTTRLYTYSVWDDIPVRPGHPRFVPPADMSPFRDCVDQAIRDGKLIVGSTFVAAEDETGDPLGDLRRSLVDAGADLRYDAPVTGRRGWKSVVMERLALSVGYQRNHPGARLARLMFGGLGEESTGARAWLGQRGEAWFESWVQRQWASPPESRSWRWWRPPCKAANVRVMAKAFDVPVWLITDGLKPTRAGRLVARWTKAGRRFEAWAWYMHYRPSPAAPLDDPYPFRPL